MGLLNTARFIAIDFETATDDNNSACSIGIVEANGLEVTNLEYHLIQPPQNKYEWNNIKIHGIKPGDTENEKSFDLLWPTISHYFDGSCYIVAHNARFDMEVLKACLNHYDLDMPSFNYLNSMSITSEYGAGNSLSDRAKYYNVPCDNHHNALNDAEVCALIVIERIKRIKTKEKNIFTFLRRYPSMKEEIRSFDSVKLRGSIPFNRFNRIDVSIINDMEVSEEFIINSPFLNMEVAFTGELASMDRETAMKKVVESGGIVSNSLRKTTKYLVNTSIRETSKVKKAKYFISKGADIKIINESSFLDLLKSL